MSHPESRLRGYLLACLGFVAVVFVAAIVHRTALLQPTPQQDEPIFVEAARLMADGRSPYTQDRYNYPPGFAGLGALAFEAGRPQLFLAGVRAANLLAVAGLAIFAAGFAGLQGARRSALAALLVALLPIVHYTFWIGNTTPVAAALALAGWRTGRAWPLAGAALVGSSLAAKPLALAGVLYLGGRWLLSGDRAAKRWLEALGWAPVLVLSLLPWTSELPALLKRMSEPPLFSSRNLSFRRVFDGLGFDVPAAAITLAVIAVAFLAARRRPVDALDRCHTAPVVSLLALPVAWAHGFLFVLPLQVAAARRWWERRSCRGTGAAALAERWGVPLGLGLIQASVNAGVEFAAPPGLRALVVLLPMLVPAALLLYLRHRPSLADEVNDEARATRPAASVASAGNAFRRGPALR